MCEAIVENPVPRRIPLKQIKMEYSLIFHAFTKRKLPTFPPLNSQFEVAKSERSAEKSKVI